MERLGVDRLINQTFGTYFDKFWQLSLAIVIGLVLVIFVSAGTVGLNLYLDTGFSPLAQPGALSIAGGIVGGLCLSLLYLWFLGVLYLAAADAQTGSPLSFGSYIRRMLPRVLPLFGVTILLILIMMAAYILVVGLPVISLLGGSVFTFIGSGGEVVGSALPSAPTIFFTVVLFVLALVALFYFLTGLSMTWFAVIFEKMGVSAIGRSWSLTQGHRWGMIGFFLLLTLLLFLIQIAIGIMNFALGFSEVSAIIGFILSLGATVVYIGLSATGYVALYLRLREIKEGSSTHKAAEQFD